MSNLAETILRDVKRYSLTQLGPVEGGQWLHYPDVLAALTAALNPALSERAGEVLEGVSDGAWKVVRNRDKTLNVVSGADADGDTHKICLVNGADEANARFIAWCREGVPALLAQNAALRAERDAQRRDLEKTIRNQRAELRRLQALERVHWQSVERWRGTREGLEGKVKAAEAERDALISQHAVMMMERDAALFDVEAAEAQNAALTARVERLTGALDKARTQDRDPDYVYDEEWEYTMRWDEWPDLVDGHDLTEPMPIYTLYKGPTKWVVQIPIDTDGDGETDDFETKLFDSEETARAALSATTEEGHDPQA